MSQVGIVVGRRFGNAVKRNRSKRRFRELVRAIYSDLIPGYHLLVFPKRDALTLSFDELKELWTATLSKHRVLNPSSIEDAPSPGRADSRLQICELTTAGPGLPI